MNVAIASSLLRAVSALSTGGTEVFTHLLSEGLIRHGVDVSLFATADSQTNAQLISVCDSTQTLGKKDGSVAASTVFELLQARQLIERSSEFDLIHNNYWHYYLLASLSSFSACPIITTVHNNFWHLPTLKESLIKTQRPGDRVVFVSRASQRLLDAPIESTVIHNGIDQTAFPFSAQAEEYVLWFSRMDPNKGMKPAMEAAKQGGFKLIMAGSPPHREENIEYVAQHITPLFSDTITHVGVPSSEERVRLYQNAKAFMLPTLMEEQFGLVLVEAMACGTPAIGFNRGAVAEVIEDGVTGFVIDPDDEPRPGKGSWSIKQQGVTGLIEAVRRIGEIDRAACRKRVEDHFTRDQMIEKYMALYRQVSE